MPTSPAPSHQDRRRPAAQATGRDAADPAVKILRLIADAAATEIRAQVPEALMREIADEAIHGRAIEAPPDATSDESGSTDIARGPRRVIASYETVSDFLDEPDAVETADHGRPRFALGTLRQHFHDVARILIEDCLADALPAILDSLPQHLTEAAGPYASADLLLADAAFLCALEATAAAPAQLICAIEDLSLVDIVLAIDPSQRDRIERQRKAFTKLDAHLAAADKLTPERREAILASVEGSLGLSELDDFFANLVGRACDPVELLVARRLLRDDRVQSLLRPGARIRFRELAQSWLDSTAEPVDWTNPILALARVLRDMSLQDARPWTVTLAVMDHHDAGLINHLEHPDEAVSLLTAGTSRLNDLVAFGHAASDYEIGRLSISLKRLEPLHEVGDAPRPIETATLILFEDDVFVAPSADDCRRAFQAARPDPGAAPSSLRFRCARELFPALLSPEGDARS